MNGFLKDRKWFPVYWIALALLVLVGDYLTPPAFQFTIVSLVPIALASWFSGRRWGIALAIVLTLSRMLLMSVAENPWPIAQTIGNALDEVVLLTVFAFLIGRLADQQRRLIKEVQVLEGMLPVCMHCKKIRDAKDSWEPLEKYITEHSEAEFSHGLCPDCAKEHYGD